jgi:hypothetical protein
MGLSIRIVNISGSPIDVFVSKYNGGNDDWFTLAPGDNDTWNRNRGWELVAFRQPGTDSNSVRAGIYVNVKKTPLIEFHSFEDIQLVEI